MANVYKQLGIHIVTAVKYRNALILEEWRPRIEAYLAALLLERKHHLIAVYAMPDHIHVFVSMHQSDSVADMTGFWKSNLSRFISDNFCEAFEWQRGYGAFAVSREHWDRLIRYIRNQATHHGARSFRDEYTGMLDKNGIEYDPTFLFDQIHIG